MWHALRWLAVGLCCAAAVGADTPFDATGNANPIVPGYFADPTIEKFGDTWYLYATTDGNGGGRGPATVWVSKDFAQWTLVPMNWPTAPVYWAPDVIRRPDGKFYLFYNQPCMTFAGVSDSPIGPWTPLGGGEGLVIPDQFVKNVITLDTQLFEDRDGSVWGYWGTWGIFADSGCGFGKFGADMKSFVRTGKIPNTQAKDFFEGPFMFERNGVYYLTYSSGSCHDASYRVQYAVSNRPDGEFVMGPNNPILASSGDLTVNGPGHHSIISEGDEHYIVYHRHDLPLTPNGMHRQICVDRLVFERDGVIRAVQPTHQGVPALRRGGPPVDLALGKPVTASSAYRDTVRGHTYKPEHAVDDNNATLWRPAGDPVGQWLRVDLGSPQRIRRTAIAFEYGTWAYRYLLETSVDGQAWQTFADQRTNTRWGSPMVDRGDATARYVRLTVFDAELPGLPGAVWNLRVYGDEATSDLEATARRAFDPWVAPRQKPWPPPEPKRGLLVDLDATRLALGSTVASWPNAGALGGRFAAGEARPTVDIAAGRKAVRFGGQQMLTASFAAPRNLTGNSRFTVAAWVLNPEIGESEAIVSWAGRGGPDACTAQVGYGTQPAWGAVGHWGFADMGFAGGPPAAGQWHHLAVAYDGTVERVYVDGKLNRAAPKMLMLNQGRPVYVGCSEPGTEYFDGYLASLAMYDRALGDDELAALAAAAPAPEALLHVDCAALPDGPLANWPNQGAWAGSLTGAQPPRVATAAGHTAVVFEPGRSLELPLPPATASSDLTILASVHRGEAGQVPLLELVGRGALSAAVPAGGWHHLALVVEGGRARVWIDGQAQAGATGWPAATPTSLRLGGAVAAAVSRVQVLGRALSEAEVAGVVAGWRAEQVTPSPSPAAFDLPPVAGTITQVLMSARRGQSPVGAVSYKFDEVTGSPGADSSGWQTSPHYLDTGLRPGTRYRYTVTLRDARGNVSEPSEPVEATTDPTRLTEQQDGFDVARDYLTAGCAGSGWDGLLAQAPAHQAEVAAAGQGVLRLQSANTNWTGGPSQGPLLYRLAQGDFVATVRVVDYAGLAARRVPGNNDAGLMLRVPQLDDAGAGEDLVQLNFFPIWDQGNMWTNMDNGGRSQRGNRLAWKAHPWLQMERRGATIYLRTSADGKTWVDLPETPLQRPDLAGQRVQVGLYHASYGTASSYATFDDWSLVVGR